MTGGRSRLECMKHTEAHTSISLHLPASQSSQGCFTKPRDFVDAFSADVHAGKLRYKCEFHHVASSYTLAVERSHLLTRALAIQEKLLPIRTIHIGDRGAFWDCRSSARIEASSHLHFEPIHNMKMASLLPTNLSKRPEKDWRNMETYHRITLFSKIDKE